MCIRDRYTYSLEIFRIVFPGLAFSSVISVVMQNYYKLMNKNHLFFFKNVLVLGISIAANFIAYYWFKTPEAISYASVVTLIIYYLPVSYTHLQVSGRNNITDFEEVVELDTKYILNWSFKLDILILLKTVLIVLKGRGAA